MLPPSVVAAVMIATAIRAAMSPYSIAVAPDSFLRKREKIFVMSLPLQVGPFVAELDTTYPRIPCSHIKTNGKEPVTEFYD